jgi:hypothetical protein
VSVREAAIAVTHHAELRPQLVADPAQAQFLPATVVPGS